MQSVTTILLSVALYLGAPIFLAVLWWKLNLIYRRSLFVNKLEWELFEVSFPKEIVKTPKSMEAVFANLFGIYSFGIKSFDKYLDGKVDRWISFEIVGHDGGVTFYVRCTKGDKHLVESAIYSHYPEVELVPTIDYVTQFPPILPNDVYDLFGAGYTLTKDNPYPIKTYPAFEEVKDEKRVDPIASLTEAFSKLKADETAWIQLLVSPTGGATGNDLKKEGDTIIKKIIDERGRKSKDKDGNEFSFGVSSLTHGDQDIIKGIENKTSKLAFQVTLRFLYLDKRATFSRANIGAIMGSFQQFNTQNMNGLRPDGSITIFGGYLARFFPWYQKTRVFAKKRRLYDNYINRRFGFSGRLSNEKLPVLNTEELATLFHFPSVAVKAPNLRVLSSRRAGPPINLPID